MFHPQQSPVCPHHHSPCTAPAALTTNNHSWKEMTVMAQSDQTRVQNQRDATGEPRPYSRQQFAKSLTLHLAEVTTRQIAHDDAGKKKTHACTECDKSFGHISNLKKHQRLHTGEKPFVCKLCDKRFNQSAHLKTHMRLHTGEKPFRCDRCNAGFSQLGNLRTHELVHTGEKPLCCERCDRSFSRSDTLRRHQRVHAARESRPFGGCKRRDKSFGQSVAHVSRHQRVHAASEGHLHCERRREKTSTESGSLNRHHECLHIGEKSFNSKPWHACFNDLL